MATRRTHSLDFKRSAVKASDEPGASIAGVAMAHAINANQLHAWRRLFLATPPMVAEPQLLPVTITLEPLPDQPLPVEGCMEIQFPRARLSIRGRVDLDVLQKVLTTLRAR